ncbi:MAG: type VI secretion system-associated FHA domain protein TagH [Methylococcales bacterium]
MNQTFIPKQSLVFHIMNPANIEGGTLPRYSFDHLGGTIGSQGANWLLTDYSGNIAPIHAEIRLEHGHFCLIDRCGQTHINGNLDPMGLNRIIQLTDGDLLQMGKYKIQVQFNDESYRHINRPNNMAIGELVDPLTSRRESEYLMNLQPLTAVYKEPIETKEPLSALGVTRAQERDARDPLSALNEEQIKQAQKKPLAEQMVNLGLGEQHFTPADFTETDQEAIAIQFNQPTAGELPVMSDKTTVSGSAHVSASSQQHDNNTELDHIIVAPLLRGMQTTLEKMDTQEAHDFLLEAGRTLKSMIDGMQNLYAKDRTKDRNLALLTRNFQPIEDNPLRLKQDYPETVESMFSPNRSKVHLSPPAAVSESLEMMDHHQHAILEAIEDSLDTLLKAFNPEVLKRRFTNYAKVSDDHIQDEAWAWQMYTHYYSELISSRQTGFEKLFWEVFEQAYDRSMRKQEETTGMQ